MSDLHSGSESGPAELAATTPINEGRVPNFIAAGIGASAGGMEAFTEFLRYLPPAAGVAVVLVHRADAGGPEDEAPRWLSLWTAMPVVEVQDGARLKPDHVYIVPANTLICIENMVFKLEPPPPDGAPFQPIDTFLRSLAEDFQSNAVGIILSGTETDGAQGLRAIKAVGGMTFAQNQTAKFDRMPRGAIASNSVDFVLSPQRIAERLTAIAEHKGAIAAKWEPGADILGQILSLLRQTTGVDFTNYKQPTILRRINRRIVLQNAQHPQEYLDLLQKDAAERQLLFNDLLIDVTGFFRDPTLFEALTQLVFPTLRRNLNAAAPLRLWVPGCSSGEEVYSLAISLLEFAGEDGRTPPMQIFGTDIRENAIGKARLGIYDAAAVANVSPERLERFFVRTEAGYQVTQALRDVCIFSRHNLANDPPLSHMDLISCRNVLIYLSPVLQKRVLSMFGYALRPSGYLVLGPSENLRDYANCFQTIDERQRIYSRKPEVPQSAFRLAGNIGEDAPEYFLPRMETADADAPGAGAAAQESAGRILLSHYAPAGLVVDAGLTVVSHLGDASHFLADPERRAGARLPHAVRPELRRPLEAAIEEARRSGIAVLAAPMFDSGPPSGDAIVGEVAVVPFSTGGGTPHYLVFFPVEGARMALPMIPLEAGSPAAGERSLEALERENARLRLESTASREYLRMVIEELRSTNEEAQAANEEMQSTNEEMQTSKEELQTSNEELNAINAEIQSRNAELARLNDDLLNLLGSMNVPVVMTGNDLRIRWSTPSAEKLLSLDPGDAGRPIADLKARIGVLNIEEIFQSVLETLQPWEQEIEHREGRVYLMRVRPYRTTDNRIDGAVLHLLEVSELKRSMAELQYARDYAEAIVNAVREPLVVLDRHLAIQNANPAFYDTLEIQPGAALGRSIFEVARRRLDLPPVHALLEQISAEATDTSDVEIEYRARDAADADRRVLLLNARRLATPDRKQLVLLAFHDITERKRAADARYRRLFESARDGIVLVDAVTGEILDLNPFTEQLLGYTRAELAHRKIWEIEPIRAVPKVRAAIDRIRDQGYFRIDDLPLFTKDGRELQTELIAGVYSEGDRRAIQFNIRDVSERRRFDRELRESQKLESIGILAGGIAHDFNNLLTGILGNASLAYSEIPESPKVRAHLREIIQAGERAAHLTRQMLAYAGRGPVRMETLDFGELVFEMSSLVRSSIPKTTDLRLNLTPGLQPIEADTAQMQQLIMNLIINAAESIEPGRPGKVEVRTSLRDLSPAQKSEFFGSGKTTPGPYVQFEVADNGCGMDEGTLARIFDPFFTTKFTGRGLGLAAVQGILRGHSGAIRVVSTPGQGTTFFVLLPVMKRKAAERPPRKEAPSRIPAGRVVLVVDDEEAVRAVVANTLTRHGMKVLLAENGRIAVDLFREHHALIAVVLLDLQMPVLGGEEAFRLMHEIDPGVPIVLSSGYSESEVAGRFSGNRPARFLQKPYTSERLLDAVAVSARQPN